jgi:purine-binding chemotaxis protein CheW
MDQQYIVFKLGNEQYAVDIAGVETIITMQPITNLPQAPSFIKGVTNLRGEVVPIMDLRLRFGLPVDNESKETRIVVVDLRATKVGLIVDAVSEVLAIETQQIEPLSAVAQTTGSDFIQGVAQFQDRLVIILDLEKILSFGEQQRLQDLQPTGIV